MNSEENPADCASRGLFPTELLQHSLWMNGPEWLKLQSSAWSSQAAFSSQVAETSVERVCLHIVAVEKTPVIPVDKYSSYTRLKCVTACVF